MPREAAGGRARSSKRGGRARHPRYRRSAAGRCGSLQPMQRLTATATAALAMALALAVPAAAQVPVPLPPVGPPGPPPPQNPPPPPPPQSEPPAAQPPGSPPTGSVTFGVDPAHTGYVDDPNLVPPLAPRWSRLFENRLGPVRAAEGRLYMVARDHGHYAVRALDPVTGKDLWVHRIPKAGDLAYDGGRIFTTGWDGVVRAFSASNGAALWTRRLSDTYSLTAGPVATGGIVYVTIGGNVFAFKESDGSKVWETSGNGTENIPAVTADRVYIAYACATVYAFNRSDGKRVWEHPGRCSGGGGSTPSVFGSRLYVPEERLVVDTATGKGAGTFPGDWTPIFARGTGLFLRAGRFTAVDMASGKVRWRYKSHFYWTSAAWRIQPVAVGHTVYGVNTEGRLYALGLEDGGKRWGAWIPGNFSGPDGSAPEGQLDVAPGLLLTRG